MDLTIEHKTFDIVRKETETTKALYLEANLDAVKNPTGEIASIVFILRDVTAARTEELIKQDSLALISHQLSAPLGVISGSISLLKNGSYGSLNEEQKKAIDAVSKQSALLVSMVEKLLGFTIVCSHSSRHI